MVLVGQKIQMVLLLYRVLETPLELALEEQSVAIIIELAVTVGLASEVTPEVQKVEAS